MRSGSKRYTIRFTISWIFSGVAVQLFAGFSSIAVGQSAAPRGLATQGGELPRSCKVNCVIGGRGLYREQGCLKLIRLWWVKSQVAEATGKETPL